MASSNVVHGARTEIDDWLKRAHRTQCFEWRGSQNGHKPIPAVTLESRSHESNDQQRIYATCSEDYSPAS
jgi:hypothetical protein